jgi:hypothetical protein
MNSSKLNLIMCKFTNKFNTIIGCLYTGILIIFAHCREQKFQAFQVLGLSVYIFHLLILEIVSQAFLEYTCFEFNCICRILSEFSRDILEFGSEVSNN